MNKKVLMVCGQEIIKERNDGGKKCSYRNYELYKNVFGEENVYLIMYSNHADDKERNSHVLRMPSHKNKVSKLFDILKGNIFTYEAAENRTVEWIEKNEIDIVIFERSLYGSMMQKMRERGIPCELWIFVHNVEKQYFSNKMKNYPFMSFLPKTYHLLCRVMEKNEENAFALTDYIMVLTPRDRELIKKLYKRDSDLILPMTFYDYFNKNRVEQRKGKEKKNTILFIGSMFAPNYDGVKWFAEKVMPEMEDCIFQIVGKDFEKKRKELERKNVVVIGTADDLDEYYYSDSIMVMPIFYGDGMKIKTAEAMMYGKTILASDEALEGYDVEGVKGIYRCNTKEDFIGALRLAFQEDYRYREEVRELFLKKYCLDNQIEKCKKRWIV